MRGIKLNWVYADNYGSMEEHGIPPAPTNVNEDGEVFITAENPMIVRR